MQKLTNRMLSLLLVLVMVISMVPAVFAAGEDASTAYAAENTTTGEKFTDLNLAIASAQSGQIVKVLTDAQDVAYSNAGVILDLNGHNLTNVSVAEGVTLSAIDSTTDDYNGSFGTLTTEGQVAPTVKTAEPKSYVTLCENGNYSFHRYYASIAAVSLQPAKAALGYRAEFRADQAVKNALVEYGYELWVNDNAHKTYTRTDKLEKTSLTLRLNNLLCEGDDARNALGSTATIGGKAFMTVNLNGQQVTLYGAEQQTTLRQVIESVNANAGKFGQAQLESVRSLCTTYAPWMMGWATENIFSGNPGEGSDGLKVEIVVDVTAENGVLAQDATMTYGDISATVPAGTALENGVKQLVLTITEKAASDSDVTEGEGESLIPLDVHISGISADNTAPIVICLGDILPKGLNIGNYDLYHVENGQTVPMTRVYTVSELDSHNEFCYDPATGSVTVAMASFSEIALRTIDENPWKGSVDTSWYDESESKYEICNADQLAGLGELVDGTIEGKEPVTFAGKTITLIGDIDLYGTTTAIEDGEEVVIRRSFNPIGFGYYFNTNGRVFAGTFDGNGNTISNLYQNGWDLGANIYTYSTAGGGLFASVQNATIKNLTMDGASIVMECIDMGTVVGYAQGNCVFENIVVKNSTLANYQRYTGGAIGEVSNGHHILKNVDVEDSTTVGTLWGDFDASVGGIIGGKWAHSYDTVTGQKGHQVSVYMENCDVAATLDVYNDVTSAYQWYSYRRAGMLIGFPNESQKDENGRTSATASFLETNNCTVQYGDWVNYHYCEFTNTTSLGARYPWVRVEAGKQCKAYSNVRYGIPQFENATLDVENHTVNSDCHEDGDGHNVCIVFNQLYGGGQGCYGGNDHVEKNLGVTVIGENGTPVESAPKFESTGVDKVLTGATVTLGELFQAVDNADIQDAYVYAFVSPANAKDSVRGTTAEPYAGCDWKDLEITFSGTGLAKVTISDYYYCQPTTIYVNVLGNAYIATKRTEGNYWYMTNDLGTASTERYQAVDSGLTTLPATIPYGQDDKVFVIEASENGYIISSQGLSENNYLGWSSGNSGIFVGKDDAKEVTIALQDDGTYLISFAVDANETRYLSLNKTSGNYFAWYAGTQTQDLVLIPVTKICEHANQSTDSQKPTCTAAGYETVTCTDCGTVISHQALEMLTHSYENGVCSVCGSAEAASDAWTLVTNISDLKIGDQIVIAAKDSNVAMSTTQNTNNRGQVAITKNDNKTIEINESVQIFTLETGTVSNTYAFYTDSGYLYAASSSSNHLKTQATNNNNGSWSITIAADGTATIIARGTNTRNQLRYNSTNNPPIFSCYGSGMDDVVIYAKPACAHRNTETVPAVPATCSAVGYTAGTRCTDCDSYISGHEEIPMADHTLDNGTETKAATCTEAGVKTYSCTVCDYTQAEEIEALGHSFTNGTCTVCGTSEDTGEETTKAFVKTALSDITSTDIVVITMTYTDGTVYALTNGNGTSSAPAATIVTVENDKLRAEPEDELKWNITNNSGNLTIYPNGDTANWLYCTNSNNGVRVGTNANNIFTIDANSGYLKNTATSRYVGVYRTTPDWRCYTNTTGNTANQTLAFYVWKEVESSEGGESGGTTEPTVVLEITKDDFNSNSYANNNNTKTENGYSYTSNQVMNQSSVMQWQSSKGYITISANNFAKYKFIKLELKVTAGTFTVTVGGQTVTGTTSNGVTTYDLTGLTGEFKISVGGATGKVNYLKFYA